MIQFFLRFAVILFTAMTLLTFLIGIIGMAKNNAFYEKNANLLMRLRVIFQGLALGAFALLLLWGK